MGLSNHLIAILNSLTAILSIGILGSGIWLATRSKATDCMRFLQWPLIVLGIFLLIVSLVGLFGAVCRSKCLLWFYAVVMFLLMLLVFCFTVFAFVVTYKGAGDAVSGKGFEEFHLGNYSTWLQRQVSKESVWSKVSACVADTHTCRDLAAKYKTEASLDAATDISPVQSGCCKPPTACGFTFGANATDWSPPTSTTSTSNTTTSNGDCGLWSDEQSELCYSCGSCKAGVLQRVKTDWHKVAIVNVVFLVFIVIVYSVSCCAIRNVNKSKRYSYA